MSITAPAPGALRPLPASPLAAAYTRLAEVFPSLRVEEVRPGEALPEGAGWTRADRLAAGGAELDAFIAWDAEQVLRDYGQAGRPDVIATFGLHRYAWPACLLITLPWFLLGRVPRFPVDQVAYDRAEGRMAVRTGTFACLPDDPAAGMPGAWVVPDEEALRAEVRARSPNTWSRCWPGSGRGCGGAGGRCGAWPPTSWSRASGTSATSSARSSGS